MDISKLAQKHNKTVLTVLQNLQLLEIFGNRESATESAEH
jgi:hypothetical protein